MKILLLEDDEDLGAAMQDGLAQSGHAVQWLRRARSFETTLMNERFDAVLLDLSLPDADGQQLLREMRRRHDATPLIVVSARGQRGDRIDMLDLGADDYLVKPIDLAELEARLRAVTRRAYPQATQREALRHGALRLDPAHGTVAWRGRRVALRERERWLLEQFMRRPQHVFTRAQLESELYGEPSAVDSNTIEVYVHYLRRKLVSDVIVTVRGVGYRLGPAHPES